MFVLYLIFVHALLLIPSYGLVTHLGIFAKQRAIQLCMAYFFSITTLALGGFVLYIFDVPSKLLALTLWALVLVGTILFIKGRSWKHLLPLRFLLILFVSMTLLSTLFISLSFPSDKMNFVPDPEFQQGRNYNVLNVKVLNITHTQANDNYIPYRQAQFFTNNLDPQNNSFINEWGVGFFQRTVLMGSVVSSFFTMLDDKPPIGYLWASDAPDPSNTYIKFQLISHVLNAVFIFPAFILLSLLFNRRTAAISAIFIAASHFYLYNAIFSWPKSLAAFFILLSWVLLLKRGSSKVVLLAGLLAGLAYMTHDMSLLYVGTTGLLLLWQKRFRDVFLYSIAVLPFMAVWAFVSSVIYSKQSTFVYYPFALKGIPQEEEKSTIIQTFFDTSPWVIIKAKLSALFYLLSPYQLIFSENSKFDFRVWGLGIYSVPGTLGPGLIIALLLGLIRRVRMPNRATWLFILLPVILLVVLFGSPRAIGFGAVHFGQALLVPLIGYSVYSLTTLKRYSNQAIWMTFVLNVIFLLYYLLYSYDFSLTTWVRSIGDVSSILLFLLIIMLYCVGLFVLVSKRISSKLSLIGVQDLLEMPQK